jgi:predicted acylesterase/phospholipase RssA
MEGAGTDSSSHFSSRRRTAVVLNGEGTAAAYLTGAMRALETSGVRADLVLGRGAGALVAAFSAIQAEDRLYGDDGLFATAKSRRSFRLRPFYQLALACFCIALAAFLAPALIGLVSIVAFPLVAVFDWLVPGNANGSGLGLEWLAELVIAAETSYLRAIALPLILLFAVLFVRWLLVLLRERRVPGREELLPALPHDLDPLVGELETRLWQAVRGASTDSRPKTRQEIGDAYRKLLTASLGQHGFCELVLYALDTDAGQEVPFVVLKDRFLKKLSTLSRPTARGEPIDLAGNGSSILFDALVASISPPGLVDPVPIKLPLGGRHGGEVHRFSSSVVTGLGAVADAIAAGAEQIIYVVSVAPNDRVGGSAWERLTSVALRRTLDEDLERASASPDIPLFLIRPERERLQPFELLGRAQLGNERLDLDALAAHGQRDVERLFVEPVLGGDLPGAAVETTVPLTEGSWEAGPREL